MLCGEPETAEQAIHLVLVPPHVPEQIPSDVSSTAYSLNIVRLLIGLDASLTLLHRTPKNGSLSRSSNHAQNPQPNIDARQFAEVTRSYIFSRVSRATAPCHSTRTHDVPDRYHRSDALPAGRQPGVDLRQLRGLSVPASLTEPQLELFLVSHFALIPTHYFRTLQLAACLDLLPPVCHATCFCMAVGCI